MRLYFIDRINGEIDVRIAEFLGGVIDAARKLSLRVKEIKTYKKE